MVSRWIKDYHKLVKACPSKKRLPSGSKTNIPSSDSDDTVIIDDFWTLDHCPLNDSNNSNNSNDSIDSIDSIDTLIAADLIWTKITSDEDDW